MAQLDRFLSAMVSQRASALRLDETALAELEIAGAARPVTKTAAHQRAGRRAAARDRDRRRPPRRSTPASPTAFGYVSDDGAFAVDGDARRSDAGSVRMTIDEGRERQRLNGHAAAIPAGRAARAAAAPPPTAPRQRRIRRCGS